MPIEEFINSCHYVGIQYSEILRPSVRIQHEDNILRQVHLVPAGGLGAVFLPDVYSRIQGNYFEPWYGI